MENNNVLMSVLDFCELYKMSKSTVYRKIGKYSEAELKGHIFKEGNKSVFLDEYAVNFLRPKSMPGVSLDDMFSYISRDIETGKKDTAEIRVQVSELQNDLSALTAVFNDSRKNMEKKLEQAMRSTSETEGKISAAMDEFRTFQETVRVLSERLATIEEKVAELSAKKGWFQKQ